MLRWRLTLGTVLIAALAGLCWLDVRASRPGMYLALLALLAAGLAAAEMARLFRAGGVELPKGLLVASVLSPVAGSAAGLLDPAMRRFAPIGLVLGMFLGMALHVLLELRRFSAPGESIRRLSCAALAILYVGGGVGAMVLLRLQISARSGSPWTALLPLLSMIAVVKLSDICQFFVGRQFGQRKLAPIVSPGKTWEGAIGGIGLASLIGGAAITWLIYRGQGSLGAHFAMAWTYCLSLGIAGLLGDLAESLLKRDAGVKDSSDWMPGFGGVLDLLDSLLGAAPVALLWWTPVAWLFQ